MYTNKLAFWRTGPHNLPASSTHPTNAAKAAKLKVRALQKQRRDRLADLQIQNPSTCLLAKINTMAELSDDFKSPRDHFLGSIIPFVKTAMGTGSVWKANSQAHLLRNILFSVYLKYWRGAQNWATPSNFSQVCCALRLENYVLVCAILTGEAARCCGLWDLLNSQRICAAQAHLRRNKDKLLASSCLQTTVHITDVALSHSEMLIFS